MERIVKFVSQSKIFRTNLLSMVFLTLGTQNFNFLRLLKAVEKAKIEGVLKGEIIAQIGNNKFNSTHIKCIPFLDKEDFNTYMEKADFIISHAGTGSIITALKKKKKIIVAPRLKKHEEHIDDHQLEILQAFTKLNLIIPLEKNLEDLEDKIKNIQHYKLDNYISNTKNFNKNLTDLINKL